MNTQSLKTVKRLFINESRTSLLEKSNLIENQSIRNSHSNLPRRKRGFVWQGRKEDQDYDKSGLLVAFYYNMFLFVVLAIFYLKKGLLNI